MFPLKRFACVVVVIACGGSEPVVTTAQSRSPLCTSASPSVITAPSASAPPAIVAVEDAGSVDAAIAEHEQARDLWLARMAAMTLTTHPSPPPPLREKAREPTHDLEIRRSAPPSIYESVFRISDGLPHEVVRRISRQNYGRFRLCFESAVSEPAKAKIVARYAIDRRGNVALAEPLASTNASPAFVACYLRALRSLSFPEPTNDLVVVEYGMSFEL